MPGTQRRSKGTSGQSKKKPELGLDVSDKDYGEMNIHSQTGLDAIALGLLNLHCGKNSEKKNYNCVAVCCVGKELWIASNGIPIDNDIVISLKERAGIECESYTVKNRGRPHSVDKMHAEMKLLDEYLQDTKVGKPKYMGVSKLCCKYCAKCLRVYGIAFTGTHENRIEFCEPPSNCTMVTHCKDCPKDTMLKEWDKPKTGY